MVALAAVCFCPTTFGTATGEEPSGGAMVRGGPPPCGAREGSEPNVCTSGEELAISIFKKTFAKLLVGRAAPVLSRIVNVNSSGKLFGFGLALRTTVKVRRLPGVN